MIDKLGDDKGLVLRIEIDDLSCEFVDKEEEALVRLVVRSTNKSKEPLRLGKREVLKVLAVALNDLIEQQKKLDNSPDEQSKE